MGEQAEKLDRNTNCHCPACDGAGRGGGDLDYCGYCSGSGGVPLWAVEKFRARYGDPSHD